MKKTALILGIISLVAWLIPIAGVIVSGAGIGLSRKPDQDNQTVALVLSIVGMVAAIVNWVWGAILVAQSM